MTSIPHRSSTDRVQHHQRERGFTMIELVTVLVVIAIITTLAYPSMQSIMHRKADLEVAAQIVALSAKVKAQATRRNKAYGIHIRQIEAGSPKAIIDVMESNTNLCEHLLDITKYGLLMSIPFGQAEVEGALDPKEDHVGISGWRRRPVGPLSADDLRLCYTPAGGVKFYDGVGYGSLTGILELAIQPFMSEGNWKPFGPPRYIEFTFASGAQIIRK